MTLSRTQRASLKAQGFTADDLKAIDESTAEPDAPKRRATDKPKGGKASTNGDGGSRRVTVLEGDAADALIARLMGDEAGEDDGDQDDDDDAGDDDDEADEPKGKKPKAEPADDPADEKPPAVNRWFR